MKVYGRVHDNDKLFSYNIFRSLHLIALAWFLYGVSSVLDTGTLDVEIINGIKKQKDGYYLSGFMDRVQQTALVAPERVVKKYETVIRKMVEEISSRATYVEIVEYFTRM